MLDPNHQTWKHESTKKLGRASFRARLVCARARSAEKADDVHEIIVDIVVVAGQGWSAMFSCRGRDRDAQARSAAAAAYLTAWAFARTASVREDGNPYSIDVVTGDIPSGVVSFSENDMEYIDSYFGIPLETLREQPRKPRP